MPGREDLIQQNRAAVRARVESAGEQASTGGEKPVYSSHRSLLGGNLDVASALDSIEFAIKGPLGDGALRNSVAYIRYWSRPGSKTTAEATSQTIDATQVDPASDSQAQLQQKLRESYLLPKTFVNSPAADYLADTYKYRDVRANDRVADDFFNFYSSGKGGAEVGVQGDTTGDLSLSNVVLSADLTKQKSRQNDLLVEIPRVDGSKYLDGVFKPGLSVAGFDQKYNVDFTAYKLPGVGQLKPANPNGFVNTLSRIGRSVLGLPPGQIGYQGAAGAAQGGKAAVASGGTLSRGMWQFLFNPSELEIVAGPEFKAAETWGVSDKANSGQPLNWSHNKNTELKFNSVLLNGYVFGRKVEELEQGIFELFMARDGEGQAGPPVLEFVWGKRVFGPCVIKEISIKEKMWDEGMVVNAELSFVLEQIPEWTINDGYVDVARPGRIPMVYDPTEENKDTAAPGATPPSDTPPGGGGGGGGASPDQKSTGQGGLTPTELYKKCQRAGVYAEQFYQIQQESVKLNTYALREKVTGTYSKYRNLYSKVKTDLGPELTSRSTSPYVEPYQLGQSISAAMNAEDKKWGIDIFTRNYKNAWSLIENAADSGRRASKTFSESSACKAEREKVDKVTKEQKSVDICRKKQPGALCSEFNISPGQIIQTCSGINLTCGSGGYLKNYNR